jgi:TonB family protein
MQPDWALPLGDPEPGQPVIDPELVLAIDARLEPPALRTVLAAGGASGAKSLRIVGSLGEPLTDREREAIDGSLPAFSNWLEGSSSVFLFLEGALPPDAPDADVNLFHGTIGRGTDVTLSPRAGSEAAPVVLTESVYPEADREGAAAYLALAQDARVPDLVIAVSRAHRCGFRPVVVLGDIPGHPDQPVVGLSALDALGALMREQIGETAFGGLGLGGQGTGGTGAPADVHAEGEVGSSGTPEVRGSLPREVIQRVIRAHLSQVRYCYERALTAQPTLAGRVTVSFVIGPSGAVQSASIQSGTLGHAETEQCIVAAVQRFTFPPPEGGGIVAVHYPFVLDAAP